MITTNDPQAAVVSALSAGTEESRAATDTAGAGSIDKVRDILFGSQMREVERRFARLEERLVKETSDLKEDLRKRLDALEAYARKEDEALADQLRAERTDRVDAHTSLSSELKETAKAHDKRTSALDEQVAKGHRELRQQMLDQHQRLSRRHALKGGRGARRRWHAKPSSSASDKTDRTALASLLTEMAMRLTNEFHLPIAEDGAQWLKPPRAVGRARRTSRAVSARATGRTIRSTSCARCSSGPSSASCGDLQEHMHDPAAQTRDVSRVLPDAIALRSGDRTAQAGAGADRRGSDHRLRCAGIRGPSPTRCSPSSVRPSAKPSRTRSPAMVESLNRTVEHSFSWRALQWRWTAFRTGKPFAEIVLLNTLQYRVEQVFLIHAETGLLLQHLSLDPRASQDADQVSAMLTAIRDFVRDSFRVAGGESLDALRIGDLSVIVEQGPHAILAGVVRGTAPHTLRVLFQDALESVHRQLSPELKAFRGDAAPFERARPILEGCLVSQLRPREKKSSYRRWIVVGALLLLALATWLFLGWRERQRWNTYLDRSAPSRASSSCRAAAATGSSSSRGFATRLSRDPAHLLAGTGVSADSIAAAVAAVPGACIPTSWRRAHAICCGRRPA